MRTRHRLVSALALAAVLAGCASVQPSTDAMLTYETKPEGAALYEAGQSIGVAPVTRTYKSDGKSASITTPEVTAVWPSGAKTSFFTLLPAGADRVATLERPANAPGLQADLDNAKKYAAQKQREQQRAKEEALRDMARDSQRCRDQMSKNNLATNDCN